MPSRVGVISALAFALAFALALVSKPSLGQSLPNPQLTPGEVRTISSAELCNPKFHTKTIRNVPEWLKHQVFAAYGMPEGNHTGYCSGPEGCEVDHLISLELGGSNGLANLWPQPYSGPQNARQKDWLENELHRRVCQGSMALEEAQSSIAQNWIKTYQQIFGEDLK